MEVDHFISFPSKNVEGKREGGREGGGGSLEVVFFSGLN